MPNMLENDRQAFDRHVCHIPAPAAPAPWPLKTCAHCPLCRSQTRPVASAEAVTAKRPQVSTTTALTAAVCPCSTALHCPLSRPHTRAVWSALLVTSRLPISATARSVTAAVWPSISSTQSPISMSHTRALPSAEAADKTHRSVVCLAQLAYLKAKRRAHDKLGIIHHYTRSDLNPSHLSHSRPEGKEAVYMCMCIHCSDSLLCLLSVAAVLWAGQVCNNGIPVTTSVPPGVSRTFPMGPVWPLRTMRCSPPACSREAVLGMRARAILLLARICCCW